MRTPPALLLALVCAPLARCSVRLIVPVHDPATGLLREQPGPPAEQLIQPDIANPLQVAVQPQERPDAPIGIGGLAQALVPYVESAKEAAHRLAQRVRDADDALGDAVQPAAVPAVVSALALLFNAVRLALDPHAARRWLVFARRYAAENPAYVLLLALLEAAQLAGHFRARADVRDAGPQGLRAHHRESVLLIVGYTLAFALADAAMAALSAAGDAHGGLPLLLDAALALVPAYAVALALPALNAAADALVRARRD